MPGGYGTIDTPWGAGGTSSPSGGHSSPGGGNVREGRNDLADAINAARSVPPQLSAAPVLQNQAQSAIAQENLRRGIGKYAGQFGDYDVDQPMATGFGSVFGASSGSTGSSQTVQDSLNFMIDDRIKQIQDEKGTNALSSQELNQAINEAFSAYYPKMDQLTEEEFKALYPEAYELGDYEAAMKSTTPGYGNLMGIPPGQVGIDELRRPRSFHAPWDSWEDPWYGGHQGGGYDDSMSDLARHYWFSESLGDVEAREVEMLEKGEGIATMADMEQMYDRDFAAKANPHFDPGYSSQWVTGELNPMAASMELFERARG